MREGEGNKYIGKRLNKITFEELIRDDIGKKVKEVCLMYEHRSQLDRIYRLTQSEGIKGAEEFGKISQRLEEVQQLLNGEWVEELENRGNALDVVSDVFEALVYQVLLKHKKVKEIEYEPELFVRGRLITPDFVINSSRIIEAKLSKNGAFKNEIKYRKMDRELIKVYLSTQKQPFDINKGGAYSILSLIGDVEKESKVYLKEERWLMNLLLRAMGYLIKVEKGRGDKELMIKNRGDTLFKIDVLKSQLNAVMLRLNKVK